MPYEWTPAPPPLHKRDEPDAPLASLHLWPYRSLPKRGFVLFIGTTAAMIALPLIAVLGSPVLWGLLPFVAIAIAGVWWGLGRSYHDGALVEELTLWPEKIEITRHNPRGPEQNWSANPYWVRVNRYPTNGRIEDYLTLSGDGREVELGAFLTAGERRTLYGELNEALGDLK
ncbi:MAG: DUF2244 domain-containing protein [Marivivens sp.]|nr:DUF2244 domain-containing protein [Marivivens sp.]